MNAISTIAQPMPLQDMQTLAVAIAKSNLFGIKTPEQALVLMAIAQAEGRHPVEAARDYDIINGKPAKRAEAMMRDFIQAGGKCEWHALTDTLADATFTHPQTGSVRIDWDMKRAMTAFGKKDMYTKFPRQMLRSRVVSEGVRTLWPLATSGMYIPEEQADIPAHNGPTIDAEAPSAARQAINDAVPMKAAAAATPRPERRAGPEVYEADPDPLDETGRAPVAAEPPRCLGERAVAGRGGGDRRPRQCRPRHGIGSGARQAPGERAAGQRVRQVCAGWCRGRLDEVVIAGAEKMAAGN